jgi:predicted ATPase/class 3 adenylate cyclase
VRTTPPPSGTVTFLFTDIEGSTQRWDRDHDAMEIALRRHDAILREAIEAHRGHVFKTIGDAFCAAFDRPSDAIAAILAAQTRLAREEFGPVGGLRVRAAVLTGSAEEREGDYTGPALDRIARLIELAHGGQVLIAETTRALIADALPRDVALRDLGQHRLRDVTQPEPIVQLVAPGLRAAFPPLRSSTGAAHSLPRCFNAFVGREREVEEISALVGAKPLVTLVGPGGIGKTRTALEVAARVLDAFPDGVWLIELAPLTNGDYLPSAIAHAVGIAGPSDGDPVEALTRALRARRLLLVLDSCEHVIAAAERVVSALLRACPGVSILASSRKALGMSSERRYLLPTLGTPTAAQARTLGASAAHDYPAIALFVERARAADHRFALTDADVAIVAGICRRLDGIPLAIELAAARVKLLTLRDLHDRLDDRFGILTAGGSDVLTRQRTLRALIDWSHDLLDERERALFRRLGIFANGFTLDSLIAVGADAEIEAFELFDVLESLVDQSLVMAEGDERAKRYRLLESTRAYARERLARAGEQTMLAERLLRHLGTRAGALAVGEARTGREDQLFALFVTELDDVRAMLAWARAHDYVAEGARLLVDLGRNWVDDGLETESIAWHDAYLAALPPDAFALRARLATALAMMLDNQGMLVRTREIAPRAVADARAADDPTVLVRALYALAWMHLRDNHLAEAERVISEAEAIPDQTVIDRIQLTEARAALRYLEEDYEAAVQLFADIRREHRALGNVNKEHYTALNIASAEHARGEPPRAIAIAEELLPEVRQTPDTTLLALLLCNLAGCRIAVDDADGGAEAAREVIGLIGDERPTHCYVSLAIEDVALACAISGDLQRAARLAGYSDAALQQIGYVRNAGEQRGYDRLIGLLHAGLGASVSEQTMAEGTRLEPRAAFALAMEPRAV